MSIQVNDFRWEPGKNDAEYIRLLESSRDEWQKLAQKAISKLKTLSKAQEPRVMTLEEVKEMKHLTICAVEQRSKVKTKTFNAEYGGIVTLGDHNFLDFGLYGNTNRFRATEAGYGYYWRCWSTKPTDEQRKAMKWSD